MLEEYIREYEGFNIALAREYYLHFSGQKDEFAIVPVYDRYSDLFTRDAIASIKRELEETSEHFETERAARRHLLAFASTHFLENSARQLAEEIGQYETRATVRAAGREMTFQESEVAVRTESDRDLRRAIYTSRLRVLEGANDLRLERLTRLHDGARSLGYDSYTALYQQLRHLDYARLAREVEDFLARTEAVYVSRLDEALRRYLGLRIEEAERPDALYFLHLAGYDEWFPADALLRVYRETMAGLGVDVERQQNIKIDSADRPRKRPRAFCVGVSVPEEIKLVIRPMGGQSDYAAFFHEAGHAQHYGWTAAALRPEFKYTGDPALSETYAFLFNYLLLEGSWLAGMLGFGQNGGYTRSATLAKLITARRCAAKFLYERELHSNADYGRASGLYSELQSGATRFQTGEAEFLYDLDDAFYSADYLRAWAFEVMLREYLKTRFGQQWWTARHAGNLLKEMWETGDRYTADQMAAQVGVGTISFDPLIDEFNHLLKPYSLSEKSR
ncbi:MAG TPA: hypothetical protein VNO70_01120 [Blastocatellia bacterium]|nr:hypothetical protein [Blastocatellia bacterium]